jgi:hypothetical protein
MASAIPHIVAPELLVRKQILKVFRRKTPHEVQKNSPVEFPDSNKTRANHMIQSAQFTRQNTI